MNKVRYRVTAELHSNNIYNCLEHKIISVYVFQDEDTGIVTIEKLRDALIKSEPQIFDEWTLFYYKITNGWGD